MLQFQRFLQKLRLAQNALKYLLISYILIIF
jgi:hypothetical protein